MIKLVLSARNLVIFAAYRGIPPRARVGVPLARPANQVLGLLLLVSPRDFGLHCVCDRSGRGGWLL